jgi:hypothetical protein
MSMLIPFVSSVPSAPGLIVFKKGRLCSTRQTSRSTLVAGQGNRKLGMRA